MLHQVKIRYPPEWGCSTADMSQLIKEDYLAQREKARERNQRGLLDVVKQHQLCPQQSRWTSELTSMPQSSVAQCWVFDEYRALQPKSHRSADSYDPGPLSTWHFSTFNQHIVLSTTIHRKMKTLCVHVIWKLYIYPNHSAMTPSCFESQRLCRCVCSFYL